MKEATLQHWWKNQTVILEKNTESPIEIIDYGHFNAHENGPDFYNAKVRIDDLLWCGSVEIHIRASDWFRHGHQYDKNYNNVVLHAVAENDSEVYNSLGEKIPTVEFRENKAVTIHENPFFALSDLQKVQLMEKLFWQRFQRKIKELRVNEKIYQFDYPAVFELLLFKSFGNNINTAFFEQLYLAAYPFLNRSLGFVYPLLMGLSGRLIQPEIQQDWQFLKTKFQLSTIPDIRWKTKGFYASATPEKRILQLSRILPLIRSLDWYHFSVSDWMSLRQKLIHQKLLSASQIDRLLINAVSIFYGWLAQAIGDADFEERGVDLLLQLPPEDNFLVRQWKSQGVHPKNAFDTQALLELSSNSLSLPTD